MTQDLHWLDKHIKEQAHNRLIMEAVCGPHTAAELQEIADSEQWEGEQ